MCRNPNTQRPFLVNVDPDGHRTRSLDIRFPGTLFLGRLRCSLRSTTQHSTTSLSPTLFLGTLSLAKESLATGLRAKLPSTALALLLYAVLLAPPAVAQLPPDFSQLPEASRMRALNDVFLEVEPPPSDPRCRPGSLDALEWVLDDESFAVRARALDVAADCAQGPATLEAVELLAGVAHSNPDRVLRQRAMAHLGRIGTPTDLAVSAALKTIEQGPRSPRTTAIVALRGMAENLNTRDLHRTITALVNVLPAKDIDVNQQAALLLAELGPIAAAAVPVLIETFETRSFSRSQVAFAFGKLLDRRALRVLDEALLQATGAEKATFEAARQEILSQPPKSNTPEQP